MLTFFTTAKPFRGHINIIQRNALKSWTLLHPDVEVILFGDDEGAAEVAQEMGLRYEPNVERTEFGAMRLDSMFGKAQSMARHDVLCYVNCDIILMSDFLRAVERVRAKYKRFLMVGRRWDTAITELLDFQSPAWEAAVREFSLSANRQRPDTAIDYFAFSRGAYNEIPPLGVGRWFWDGWLVWKAVKSKVLTVDASPVVIAVHQDHDYRQREKEFRVGEEAQLNCRLSGGWEHMRSVADATVTLQARGFRRNRERYWRAVIKPWWLGGEIQELELDGLGRVRHFKHRCRFMLVNGGQMTRAQLAYSWISAFFELIVGRKHSHYLEGVRTRARKLRDRLRARSAAGETNGAIADEIRRGGT